MDFVLPKSTCSAQGVEPFDERAIPPRLAALKAGNPAGFVEKCPRCGAESPTLKAVDRTDLTDYYCHVSSGGCGKRTRLKKNPQVRGRKPLGDQKLTPREKVQRCLPILPYTRGKMTWYVVSTLIHDGSNTVFKCLEWGSRRSLEQRYPDDQVLAVRRYPAAKQREYAAMIEQANKLTTGE